MKYEICSSPTFSRKKLTFNDLSQGDIFRADGHLYFRLSLRLDIPYNAISLADGEYEYFDSQEPVELYTGKITFFEDYFKNEQEN